MSKMRLDYTRCNWCILLTATTDAGTGSSHRCRVISGSSTTLIRQWPMLRFEIPEWWSLVGACVRKSRLRDGITVGYFLFLSSLHLFFWSRHSTNGVGMGFYHLRSHSSGGGVSMCTWSAEWSPLFSTDRLWDILVRTIAYVGWFFHSLFPFPSLHF